MIKTFGNQLCGAQFSECRTYRYALWRRWNADDSDVGFIGLNPSTADEAKDDPTIRRCIGFAKAWGYGGVVMLNLFAFRATEPADMKVATDPVGPMNDHILREYAEVCGRLIAAWGVHGEFQRRDLWVARLNRVGIGRKTPYVGDLFECLGTTKDGFPRHPLYVRADAERKTYRVKGYDRQ